MEARPNYSYGGPRPLNARATTWDPPRYVISLRDPVARFWSDFTYMKSKVLLPADMGPDTFLARCLDADVNGLALTEQHRHFRTFTTGRYADFLPLWLDAGGDRLRVVF